MNPLKIAGVFTVKHAKHIEEIDVLTA